MQSRALQALQSLAKGKRGGSKLPMQAIQTAFQQGKGLPRLVTLLDKVTTPRRNSTGQGKAIMAGAVDALAAMTRNNAACQACRYYLACRCSTLHPCEEVAFLKEAASSLTIN